MTDTCNRGHEWTPSNTYSYTDTYGKYRRKCKKCTLILMRAARDARVARRASQPPPPARRDNETVKCTRVNRLLHLQDKLERETRAWLRHDIQAEIDKLQCG